MISCTRFCRPLRQHNGKQTPSTAERKKIALDGYFRGVYKTQQEAAEANAIGAATISREVRKEVMAGRRRDVAAPTAPGLEAIEKSRSGAMKYAIERTIEGHLSFRAATQEANEVLPVAKTCLILFKGV